MLINSVEKVCRLSTPAGAELITDTPSTRRMLFVACATPYFLPHCMMLYSNYFRVTVDATNKFEAQRKALKKIKEDPTAFLTGTYIGVGKKENTSLTKMLFFGK